MIAKKIFSSKRGIAVENAILFLLVIFSLCALLTGLTMIGHYQVKIENNALLRDVQIDQIGEDYLISVAVEETFNTEKYSYENYTYAVEGNTLTVWHNSDVSNVVLFVEATWIGENQVQVLKWQYTPPAPTE